MTNTSSRKELPQCHVCGVGSLELVPGYSRLARVTSDCQPWKPSGQLAFCTGCFTAQTPATNEWQTEANEIYGRYTIYSQSNGAEQRVFQADNGKGVTRSDRLLDCLLYSLRLGSRGLALDVGCGNGAFLRSFHSRFPDWRLVGSETTDKYRAEVESIKGVEGFFAPELPEFRTVFQFISMIHVLEHVPEPSRLLEKLRGLLSEDGVLFVQVPDYLTNPFELVIADHCTHFSSSSLRRLIVNSGFEIFKITADWVPKELSVLASRANTSAGTDGLTGVNPRTQLLSRVQWLSDLADQAMELARKGGFGVFGTSIGAAWIATFARASILFFVDEDPDRVGKKYFDRIVHKPGSAPKDYPILLSLAPNIAQSIESRLCPTGLQLVLPPKLPTNEEKVCIGNCSDTIRSIRS